MRRMSRRRCGPVAGNQRGANVSADRKGGRADGPWLTWCGHRAAAGALRERAQPGERRVGWIGFGEAWQEELLGACKEVRSIHSSLALRLFSQTHSLGWQASGWAAGGGRGRRRERCRKLDKSDASAPHTQVNLVSLSIAYARYRSTLEVESGCRACTEFPLKPRSSVVFVGKVPLRDLGSLSSSTHRP